MPRKLYDAYNEILLATSPADGTLSAVAVPGRAHDYISAGTSGQPVILLSCGSSSPLQRAPIGLQHLTVEFGIRCLVRTNSTVEEGYFVIISLRGTDLGLAESFCVASEALISALPAAPRVSDIEKVVRQFVELMTALSLPSSRAIAGLWAELWLISVATDPQAAVIAWHENSTARFDFAFSEHFVEVKATEREERTHEFSYEQLRRSALPITVASLRLRRAQNGTSIADLIDALTPVLTPAMRTKLVKNIFDAIGNGLSEASEIRFDDAFAHEHLRIITADKVPVAEIPDGSPIFAVRFRVNLDDVSLAPHLIKPVANGAFLPI